MQPLSKWLSPTAWQFCISTWCLVISGFSQSLEKAAFILFFSCYSWSVGGCRAFLKTAFFGNFIFDSFSILGICLVSLIVFSFYLGDCLATWERLQHTSFNCIFRLDLACFSLIYIFHLNFIPVSHNIPGHHFRLLRPDNLIECDFFQHVKLHVEKSKLQVQIKFWET